MLYIFLRIFCFFFFPFLNLFTHLLPVRRQSPWLQAGISTARTSSADLLVPAVAFLLTIFVFLAGFVSPGLNTLSGSSQLKIVLDNKKKKGSWESKLGTVLLFVDNINAVQILVVQIPDLAHLIELLTGPGDVKLLCLA